jgi:hypothetical protein
VGVLIRAAALAALAVAGCYRPEVADCTVTCGAPGDCAGGQVCADGWCVASAELAASCAARPDGPPAEDDARPIDASVLDGPPPDAPPPDASLHVLHVIVQGRGKVVVSPLGVECVGSNGAPGDCEWSVEPGSEQTLLPVDTHPADSFAGWSTANCSAEPAACVLAMDAAVTLVGATFE